MTSVETRSTFLARAVGWLRAGYPTGVPRQDYVVLLGLLRRSLTEDEVRAIAADLVAQSQGATDDGGDPGVISRADIARTIDDSMLQEASDDDIARVCARLAAAGWPLAAPPLPEGEGTGLSS